MTNDTPQVEREVGEIVNENLYEEEEAKAWISDALMVDDAMKELLKSMCCKWRKTSQWLLLFLLICR